MFDVLHTHYLMTPATMQVAHPSLLVYIEFMVELAANMAEGELNAVGNPHSQEQAPTVAFDILNHDTLSADDHRMQT